MITGCLTGGKKLSFSRLPGTIYGFDARPLAGHLAHSCRPVPAHSHLNSDQTLLFGTVFAELAETFRSAEENTRESGWRRDHEVDLPS